MVRSGRYGGVTYTSGKTGAKNGQTVTYLTVEWWVRREMVGPKSGITYRFQYNRVQRVQQPDVIYWLIEARAQKGELTGAPVTGAETDPFTIQFASAPELQAFNAALLKAAEEELIHAA